MIEKALRFGPDGKLFGILTSPSIDQNNPDAPIVIILNAGIVHRMGPFRLHVDIARQLAGVGCSTLRIDLSGLGDSAPRTGLDEMENRAQLDLALAMDELTQLTGVQQFVLIGLCSGAFNAHQITVADERVKGAVFLDGIVFRTAGYYVRHHLRRLFRPRFWRNAWKRRVTYRVPGAALESAGQGLAEDEFFGKGLDRLVVRDELHALRDRGTRMLFIYTEGFDDICGRAQFAEMYGIQPDRQIQVEYYQKSTHTFRLTENRHHVCQRIADWFEQQFNSAQALSSH